MTCVNKSQPAAIDDTAVVSDIGEQWSPKIPPLKIAATTSEGGKPNVWTKGIPIGIKIAKVPHDVPVVKDIMPPAINNIGTTKNKGR